MSTSLPPAEELRTGLSALSHAQMQKLAADSGVPFTTLWKIRAGATKNPGIETVRLFYAQMLQLLAGNSTANDSSPAPLAAGGAHA